MADREVDQFFKDQTLDTMPEENVGHTCIYMVDEEDRNFKVCVVCGHTEYRTDQEVQGKVMRRVDCDDGA